MFFTLAIPFVTGPTVLNLHRVIPFPLPNEGTDGYALQYAIELGYFAIAESTSKTALLLHDEIDRCIGPGSFLFAIMASRLKLLMTHV